jgi:N-acetylmuramoyl-L-alanine amidase
MVNMLFFLSYKEVSKRYLPWIVVIFCATFCLTAFSAWNDRPGEKAVTVMSWVVVGRRIVIDPGHGGEDPGKVGVGGSYEKDINLEVAFKLKALLVQGGADVVMTRERDCSLCEDEPSLQERKRGDLIRRLEIAEESKAGIYVSLHCNSFPKSNSSGAQVFYAPQAPGSNELAQSIQRAIAETLRNTRRQPKDDATSLIMKHATIPTVNVEMGFLSNALEEELLQRPEYQHQMAWAVYCGIVYYFAGMGM